MLVIYILSFTITMYINNAIIIRSSLNKQISAYEIAWFLKAKFFCDEIQYGKIKLLFDKFTLWSLKLR